MKKTAWDNVYNVERVVMERQAAINAGFDYHFTGRECKKAGHVTLRHVSGGCCECSRLRGKARNQRVVRPAPAKQPAFQPKQGQAEDRAILPADLAAPITDAERAYWAARPNADGCLALLGKIIRQALADGDERGAQRLCEALGLNYRTIANQAERVLPNQAKKAKA